MPSAAHREQVLIESRPQWRDWLVARHDRSSGIWLVRWKAGSGHPVVSYDDVVDEAIAFGWVDSRPRALDEHRSQLLLTPRKPTSSWSRMNKARAEALTTAGLMSSAGLAAVDLARQNGSWNRLDDIENLIEPDELRTLLDATDQARQHWDNFPRSTRRAILEWINSAKTATTRTARIEQAAADAAVDIRANQWRQPHRTGR